VARAFDPANPDDLAYGHVSALDGATQVAVSMMIYPITPAGGSGYETYYSQIGANGTGPGNGCGIALLKDALSHKIHALCRNNTAASSISVEALTPDTWQHLFFQYDGTQSAGSRVAAYINATALTWAANVADASLGTGDQAFRLGAYPTLAWKGRLAEVYTWVGAVLSADERAALAAGAPAALIRPASLVFDAPLVTDANDRLGRAATVTGTTVVEHPRVYRARGSASRQFFAPPVGQIAVPISDISEGTWTPSSGSDLYPMLADADDATYIRSSSGATADVAEVALSPLVTPAAGTVTLHVRHRAV